MLSRYSWKVGLRLGALGAAVAACVAGCRADEEQPDGMGGAGAGGLGGEGGETGSAWIKVELPGAVCADGSGYKFFFRRAEQSAGLVVTLEPGGACWNYETCGGDGGPSRAAHLDGLDDDHMIALPPPVGTATDGIPWGLMFPHLGLSDGDVATFDYDQVYLPYCTGDGFLGDFAVTYESPDGRGSIDIQHRGAANMSLVLEWLGREFASPEQLLVVGSSAGALGATLHYAALRDAVGPERAAFINDSSPIFPPGGPQVTARQAFAERWRTEALLRALDARLGASPEQSLAMDSGHITALLSAAFPDDRFLVTYFLSDLNNSHFAYGELFDEPTVDEILELWLEDTELLVQVIEQTDNWGYYLPAFRADNCSHTVTLLPVDELSELSYFLSALQGTADGYLRTDLEELDFADALESVLASNGSLIRRRAPAPMADFTASQAAACLNP